MFFVKYHLLPAFVLQFLYGCHASTIIDSSYSWGKNELSKPVPERASEWGISQDVSSRYRRDDVALAIPEMSFEQREREYADLDPNDPTISPFERLFRVAARIVYTGEDIYNWSGQWAAWMARPEIPIEKERQRFSEFAYKARFGPDRPASPVTSWIYKFDRAYRQKYGLVQGTYTRIAM